MFDPGFIKNDIDSDKEFAGSTKILGSFSFFPTSHINLSWTDFIFLFVSRVRPTIFAKSNMVPHFAEKRFQKRAAKLQKLTCMLCDIESFSDCYRTAQHVLSPGCCERIRANRRSGLKRKLFSSTRKSYNFMRDNYEGC